MAKVLGFLLILGDVAADGIREGRTPWVEMQTEGLRLHASQGSPLQRLS